MGKGSSKTGPGDIPLIKPMAEGGLLPEQEAGYGETVR